MRTATKVKAFSLADPLPSGTTVLEASAGTGKTYTIAALAARYVAEGRSLSELLLVSFGRTATDELRLRIRQRLVEAEALLAEAVEGRRPPHPDDLQTQLLAADAAGLSVRQERLRAALAAFDTASIATTHEFCLQMLESLGVLGDFEEDPVFVDRLTELTREVAGDVYLRRYSQRPQPPIAYAEALQLADMAVATAHTDLVPDPDVAHDVAAERTRFTRAVREEVEQRKRANRLFTYDDMLGRLQATLADPVVGEAAAQRLRDRYRVVMIDEFQDTDPVQWDIVRRAFAGSGTTLILIGDPKQAIYAFRGADVYSYLDAVGQAGVVGTLSTNWRSDQPLLDALDALIGGAALGDPRIVVRPVQADQRERRLWPAEPVAGEPHPPAAPLDPVRLRYRPYARGATVPLVQANREAICSDLVADVTALLAARVRLTVDGGAPRPVAPSDIAVLVRRNEHGEAIRDALVRAGVPAVMLGATSVFAGAAAADWLLVLRALEDPRQSTIRRAALTALVGWSFRDLVTAEDDQISHLTAQVRRWSRLLAQRGMAAVAEAVSTDTRLAERLLGQIGGDRLLTDLRHVAQACHSAMVRQQWGARALVEWVQERIGEARRDTTVDGSRRLEVDAAAVTVVTVHRSKGLQFPIVYLPDPWDRWVKTKDEGQVLLLHDPSTGRRQLDVGGTTAPGRAERLAQSAAEDSDEDLRLFYVAATRAQCQVVMWWAPGHTTAGSALQRLLHRPLPDAPSAADAGRQRQAPSAALSVLAVPDRKEVDADPSHAPRARALALEMMPEVPRPPTPWHPTAAPPETLAVRPFNRDLDLSWRRTSYSALTALAHSRPEPGDVMSEPEASKEDDEPPLPDPADPAAGAAGEDGASTAWGELSPMSDLPGGATFGTAVHAVLEQVDPTAPDLLAELRRACAEVLGQSEPTGFDADTLAGALLPSFLTPLGPLAGQRRLRDIPRRDRLAELAFEYPLNGGDHRFPSVRPLLLADVAMLLRRHLLPPDPLADYPDRLGVPELGDQLLRGFLNGSIDAVLRVPSDSDGAGSQPRYLVVDYKTNRLAASEEAPVRLGDYRPDRLAEVMMAAHYPLQALLYQVALHRLLRWRQPDYRPDVHLGGVLYLFVRGMAGDRAPTLADVPSGVFSWRPPPALVEALSDLLDTGAVEERP